MSKLPKHIAIIMDGNGRWARRRGLPRIAGHRAGIESVRDIVRACARLKIKALTLYAFSTENWARPKPEVTQLMSLLEDYLIHEREELMANGVRLKAIGRPEDLPRGPREALARTRTLTSRNRGMVLSLALSYSGRDEILRAARKAVTRGRRLAREADFSKLLDSAGLPDPDLLIRTGGDMRVSNFLLWQIAYTEIYVTKTHWPVFRKKDLAKALKEFASRERRFGRVSPA